MYGGTAGRKKKGNSQHTPHRRDDGNEVGIVYLGELDTLHHDGVGASKDGIKVQIRRYEMERKALMIVNGNQRSSGLKVRGNLEQEG
jgi:hypothetical protein